jgi:ubiquinone/menaquinone biosynthesis C-methylase UbiE
VRPNEVTRDSAHHQRFLELTLRNRGVEVARGLLEAEWRYIGPLLRRPAAATRVLDLACGTGTHTVAFAERGFTVSALDFDQRLLAAGRDLLRQQAPSAPLARWACGDARSLPYGAAAFDLVFSNSLLEHVPDWRSVLAEVSRVLAPGGVFVMYTTNRTCPLQQEVNHFPFYSWLPDPVQRRVLAWIMAHRRDLVNFTDFPAVNWFTFPGMARAFREVGLEPHDRLDLLARQGMGGAKGALVGAMSRVDLLKWPYRLYAVSMGLYGVKRG